MTLVLNVTLVEPNGDTKRYQNMFIPRDVSPQVLVEAVRHGKGFAAVRAWEEGGPNLILDRPFCQQDLATGQEVTVAAGPEPLRERLRRFCLED
jgi:hypothetical protein